MEAVFLKFVNMSITAGWLVLAIATVRLLFRRTPKRILCLLWGLVALRLVCPFSIESALSLIPSAAPLPQEIIYTAHPEIQSGITAIDNAVNPMLASSLTPVSQATSANPTQIWSFIFTQIWLLGILLMAGYGIISYLLLRRRVAAAIPVRQNIRRCEFIDSPFVLGFFPARIYLPAALEKREWEYVLKHEESHIEHHDHWWKLLGFTLLCLYWFNPLMWLAYVLFCRDLEGACDERVIRDLDREGRRAYAEALLNCSLPHRSVTACPLAFGEVSVKKRVQNVMDYKKPGFWILLISVLVCIVLAAGFLTNPETVYDYDRTYPQSQLKAPDRIQVLSGNGETILYEKDSDQYHRLLETLRKNWWKYTPEDLETASDEALVPVPAPEVIRTKSWKTHLEMKDDTIQLIYESEPFLWEDHKGKQTEIRMMAFLLPQEADNTDSTRNYFMLNRSTDFTNSAGIYTYYYPAEIAHDFWRFLTQKSEEVVTVVSGKNMSINDVIALSPKGEDLTVSDFDGFAYEEKGSYLLYSREFPINDVYALWLGHGGGLEKPIYCWLVHLTSGDRLDITQGNEENQITDFIAAH